MSSSPPPAAPVAPTTVLLATDLSSRCDRALDRAVILTRQWDAHLVALTVVEPGAHVATATAKAMGTPGAQALSHEIQLAERHLRADLAMEDVPLTTRVEKGPVTEAILGACEAHAAGLVVTGVARNEALSRLVLGSSVDALARRSPVPLLVVRRRARAAYREVVVASDFSSASRHALETAAALFPDAGFTLFHAFGNPYPAIGGIDPAQVRNDGHRRAEAEATAFLQACELPQPVRHRLQLSLAYGDAGALLHARSASHPDDAVVLGTQRRGGLLRLLLGSVAQRILEQSENDVLLVPQATPDH